MRDSSLGDRKEAGETKGLRGILMEGARGQSRMSSSSVAAGVERS